MLGIKKHLRNVDAFSGSTRTGLPVEIIPINNPVKTVSTLKTLTRNGLTTPPTKIATAGTNLDGTNNIFKICVMPTIKAGN